MSVLFRQKEIHKALRARIAAEQIKLEIGVKDGTPEAAEPINREMTGDTFSVMKKNVKPVMQTQRPQPQGSRPPMPPQRPMQQGSRPPMPAQQQQRPPSAPKSATQKEIEFFGDSMEDLIGTRAAFMVDDKLNVLGKMNSGIYAVILDDVVDPELLNAAERANIQFLVAMDTKVKSSRLTVLTADDL